MTSPGLAALSEGGRIDFATMRAARQERLYLAMDDADLDVLVLGRPASVTYATGVRMLWTAGSRPFSPSCVVVREGRRVHLLATWDEGVPAEIPHEQLFGLSWNPSIAAGRVAAIDGLAGARRIGSDGTSVSFTRLMAGIAPDAELVDSRGTLRDVAARKLDAEVAAIETACAIAEGGLEAMQAAVRPGATSRQLLGELANRLGDLGEPVVPDEAIGFSTVGGYRHLVDDRPFTDGGLVVLSPSARHAGYLGTIARTVPVAGELTAAQRELGCRGRAALDAVIESCVAGATGRELMTAWRDAGGGALPAPIAHGVGLGADTPVIDERVGAASVIEDGTVLAVQAWIPDDELGGWLERDVVAVTDDGPRTLTRWSDPE